jgi:hypothetical protein
MNTFEPTRDAVDRFALINYSAVGAGVYNIAKLENLVPKLGAPVQGEAVNILKGLRRSIMFHEGVPKWKPSPSDPSYTSC